MVKKIIISLLVSWIAVTQANTVNSEKELIAEFEESFEYTVNCSQDFARCAQERKAARDKYLTENKHRIKRPVKSDAQLKHEIMNEYNHSKKQREIVTREGNSFNQVIIKEEPKKSLIDEVQDAKLRLMGIDKLAENWGKRSTELMNETMRKQNEKARLCKYWIENQNKHPQGKQHKEQACK